MNSCKSFNVHIVFEDECLLVVDKPSGLVVHSDQRTEEETLCDWVEQKYPELSGVGGVHMLDMGRTEARWGIVNRLDREVSGCILIAKDEKSFTELARQFRDREVVKKYIAVIYGNIVTYREISYKEGQVFEIDKPIGRHRKDPRRWAIDDQSRNTKREAKTMCKVLKITKEYSVLELSPVTGRTHQLRLHVNSLGSAILGDLKYGLEDAEESQINAELPKALGASRIMLHALSLSFIRPETKGRITVASTLPRDFYQFIQD